MSRAVPLRPNKNVAECIFFVLFLLFRLVVVAFTSFCLYFHSSLSQSEVKPSPTVSDSHRSEEGSDRDWPTEQRRGRGISERPVIG